MSKEVVAEVIALIELGLIAPEDIVKCLRKANSEPAQQELSGWIGNNSGAFIKNVGQKNVTGKPLYATPQPAQRTWVGLSDEEKTELRREHYPLPLLLMEATEAKLRSKNEDRN